MSQPPSPIPIKEMITITKNRKVNHDQADPDDHRAHRLCYPRIGLVVNIIYTFVNFVTI